MNFEFITEQDRKGPSAWMKKVLVSGTAADKMAALVIRIQDSPVHNLSSLDNLISMLKMKERRKSLKILGWFYLCSFLFVSLNPSSLLLSNEIMKMFLCYKH